MASLIYSTVTIESLSPPQPENQEELFDLLANFLLIAQLGISQLGAIPLVGLTREDWNQLQTSYKGRTEQYVALTAEEIIEDDTLELTEAASVHWALAEGHQVRGEELKARRARIQGALDEAATDLLASISRILEENPRP